MLLLYLMILLMLLFVFDNIIDTVAAVDDIIDVWLMS